ncbi:MAG: hypothetical protein CM1200mP39_02320 [Dehalococcoidia bacterium]|nr:MAG: hypothetical protein CM1200mP39_02320 [Dehalococcoidia bacterium]
MPVQSVIQYLLIQVLWVLDFSGHGGFNNPSKNMAMGFTRTEVEIKKR